MAKNWSLADAVRTIHEGKDLEAIKELSRRYPLLAYNVASGNLINLMDNMPEYLTANKLNKLLDKSAPEVDGGDEASEPDEATDEAEETAEAPARCLGFEELPHRPRKTNAEAAQAEAAPATKPVKAAKAKPVASENDYESMAGKALFALVTERGLKAACKGNFKKENLAKVLRAGDAGEVSPAIKEVEAAEAAEEAVEGKYDGMKAIDLYKMCTKRGLKVDPKKQAAYYIAALTKDDEKPAKAEEEDEWGDDDDAQETPAPAPKPAKTVKPAPAAKAEAKAVKPAAKSAAKADDDWDI